MPYKNFEHTIKFHEFKDIDGSSIWLPLVEVILNNRITLSLIFDTGATVTTLRSDLFPALGLKSWDEGVPVKTASSGGVAEAYQYPAELTVFGMIIKAPVKLMKIPPNPLYNGLLGRDTIFNNFGFGFWETTHELFITTNP